MQKSYQNDFIYWKSKQINVKMGQTNECCRFPFGEEKFDINEVRLHWPEAAQRIRALRQANKSVRLMTNTHNNNKGQQKENTNQSQRSKNNKVYRQFITREYCFFGYLSENDSGSQSIREEQYYEDEFELDLTQNNEEDHQSKMESSHQKYRLLQSLPFQQRQNLPLAKQRQSQPIKQKQSSIKVFSPVQQKQRTSASLTSNAFPSTLVPSITLNSEGILIQRQKACYYGCLKNNQYHGKGSLSVLQNQQHFKGVFENGEKLQGVYETPLVRYQGRFKGNRFTGLGRLLFKETMDIYEGHFLMGKMHGNGKMVYSNGDSYQGQFNNGLYDGQGIYSWQTGAIFKGRYKKGKKHGFGIIIINSISHQLCWVNDVPQAKPMNYIQFKTLKDIETSKTNKTIQKSRRKNHNSKPNKMHAGKDNDNKNIINIKDDRDDGDEVFSIVIDRLPKTDVCIAL